MKKIKFTLLVLALLSFGISAIAQTKTTLKGEVVDKDNQPVIGASIIEKGTTNGTVTNIDGKFSLNVSNAKSTLRITCVGYEKLEVTASSVTQTGKIKLQESSVALNEVVAIGYGVVKKNDATGSVNAIKPDKLNKGLTLNAQDMLVGKIAGVSVISNGGTPGGGAQIRIRGGSSLSASNDPLIVIDGLAMDNEGIKGVANSLSTINPNDIETFTVLKDASATAIYGSRASNGVIIITTKKGEKGLKARVSYDGNVSISSIKKTIDVLSADEFRTFVNGLYSDKPDIISKLGTANTDWQKEVYRDALSHDHNLSVTGGLKNMPYRISAGYTNQDGIIKTSNFERYTGGISLNPSLLQDHLKMNFNAKAMLANNRYADGGVVGSSASMDPTQPISSTDPNYVTNFGGYFQWYNTDAKTGRVTANSLATRNPVATLNHKNDVAKSKDFIGSAEFDYKFHYIPELKAHLSLGTEVSTGTQTLYIDSLDASDHHHGRQGWETIDKINQSLNFYTQYSKEINQHKFDIMAGYEWQKFHRESNNEYQGLETDLVDPATLHVGGYDYKTKIFKTESFLVSFFGRANYSYANKYLLTATIREDGSSRFAPASRWGFFPAAALAWKITEEDFLKDNNSISDLKLRLGYGVTGQQNINQGDYPYIPVYASSITGAYYPLGDQYLVTYRPNKYNYKLKWEETTTYNAGIDFGFFKSRFTGSLDYYFRETTNLLNEVDVAALTTYSNPLMSNIGSLQNQGVEFSFNLKAISKKDFSWEIGYNITYNKNEITKLISGSGENYKVKDGTISSGTGNYVKAHAVGHPASSFLVYEQIYDADGKPIEGSFVDRNKDGTINDDDRYYYHKPSADVLMGFTSRITFKGFDLGISIRASFGNYVYNDIDARSAYVGKAGIWSSSGFFSNKPKSAIETNFTQNKTNYYLSDYYIQNASFVRCDNITLGYSFKRLINSSVSGRIYATVQNPLIITKYKGLDPEITDGVDKDLYPRPMISLVGLSLNF